MKIGNVEIKTPVFLSPLAGVTDKPFRVICKKMGCGMAYTEMVSAKGLYYNDEKTKHLLDIDDTEHPIAVQIFGSDPEIMAEIVPKALKTGADIIDINMGCPMPKIVNNGDGSSLMRDPQLAGRVVRAVADASPVPVTVKMRTGWDADNINCTYLANVCEQNGAAAVAIHGRTKAQLYSGKADWSMIKKVKAELSVPVIGNGDIFTAHDAIRMFDETGCDAVMVARGAEGNPWIFTQIKELMEYGEIKTYPTDKEKIDVCIEHLADMVAFKGERIGVCESRRHIASYLKGMRGGAKLKQHIYTLSSSKEVIETLREFIK